VKSYLSPRDVFRYVLPHSAPADASLLYFPYWRFKGMVFSCAADGVHQRFLDLSQAAADDARFPLSLGLRSQALKLRFLTPGLEGRFIRPTVSMAQIGERLAAGFTSRLPAPIRHQVQVGENWSLIYAPFYFRGRLYDGILNRPLSGTADPDSGPERIPAEPAGDHLRFIAAICPRCGADLEGEKTSLVLACRNCDAVWSGATGDGFTPLPCGHVPGAAPGTALFLPFWQIEAGVSGIELRSYADLIRTANLPKVIRAPMESQPFRFWSLAFKLRPRAFLNLAARLTLAQPRDNIAAGLPAAAPTLPVTLGHKEAVETLKTTLAEFVKPRKTLFPRLPEIDVTPKRLRLVYLPFEDTPHDLVHSGMRLAVNKAMLATAGNL
jgi:hypothetical protein